MNYVIQTTLQLGLVYALVPLALFISYRILNIADLTTDGCFVLGMAVAVSTAYLGHPFLGILAGMLAGSLAGMCTALLITKLAVPNILAGIITNTGLYTINLMVMGFSSNMTLLKKETIFTLLGHFVLNDKMLKLVVLVVIVLAICLCIVLFFKTHLGLAIKATGDNSEMIESSSINPKTMILIGLMLSNSLTGLSGALVGNLQKSADINAGSSIVVIGLACLIIGETLVGKKNITQNCFAAVIGSIIYRFIYAMILKTNIFPIECLKLLTAIIVASAIALPTIKSQMALNKKKNMMLGGKNHA